MPTDLLSTWVVNLRRKSRCLFLLGGVQEKRFYMAKLHSAFVDFNDSIVLSKTKRNEIRVSRNAIRDTIKTWMNDNDKGSVCFCMQGSFAMDTVISPLDDDEYDVDDGIYLKKYDGVSDQDWPACDTVHNWIKTAVAKQATSAPVDKNACVRVVYQRGYHVDIPIYIIKNERAYLANKQDGWINSDAKDFKFWFSNKCESNNGQLRRCVRYLKRWKDYNDIDLKGIEITILASNSFSQAPDRDDDALRYTVEEMVSSLNASFSCVKPVAPNEDLLAGSAEDKQRGIIDALQELEDVLVFAHDTNDASEGINRLREKFGDDFPSGGEGGDYRASVITAAPAVLKRDGRSG